MTEPPYPTYDRLIALLDEKKARYRVIEHIPEGHTELISPIRGNPLNQAAKCIIVMLKPDKKTTKHVLVVVPGDTKVDFKALKSLYGASYCSFASVENAERLGGSVVGRSCPSRFIPTWSWSPTPGSSRRLRSFSTRRASIARSVSIPQTTAPSPTPAWLRSLSLRRTRAREGVSV